MESVASRARLTCWCCILDFHVNPRYSTRTIQCEFREVWRHSGLDSVQLTLFFLLLQERSSRIKKATALSSLTEAAVSFFGSSGQLDFKTSFRQTSHISNKKGEMYYLTCRWNSCPVLRKLAARICLNDLHTVPRACDIIPGMNLLRNHFGVNIIMFEGSNEGILHRAARITGKPEWNHSCLRRSLQWWSLVRLAYPLPNIPYISFSLPSWARSRNFSCSRQLFHKD